MNDPSRTGEYGPTTLRSASADETRRLGEALGGVLRAGDVVLLQGELGAGKTAFTQGIGRGLGVAVPVNSPTFTLLKEYSGRLPLYHFDLYRVDDADEQEALGFEQYFEGDGVSVVEWAERGEPHGADAALWPPDWLRMRIVATGETQRQLICTAHGARGAALLEAFALAAPATNPATPIAESATSATPTEKSATSATSAASAGGS